VSPKQVILCNLSSASPKFSPHMTKNVILHKDIKVKFVDGGFPRCLLL